MKNSPDVKERGWLVRLLIQRSLGFLYANAFLIALNQFPALAGQEGILPLRLWLRHASWAHAPSLFLWHSTDLFILQVCAAGLFLALLVLTGISERFGYLFSALVWGLLWALYLSVVNAGQTFYGFGWETLLLETGFLAIFLGPADSTPPKIILWLYRWLIFRLMFGAGLIKLRGDSCWRDLTCMEYHYETQPLPNPLSWYFHKLPLWWHQGEVLFTHITELVVPFAYFIPGTVGVWAGMITIFFHITLILSGNLSWLNYITIVITFACLSDRVLAPVLRIRIPETLKTPGAFRKILLVALTLFIAWRSIPPVQNMISRRQMMNASFEPFHFVNTYGAFGGITRKRFEIVLEGTGDARPGPASVWKEYEFKCKPGDVTRAPCVISPYHYKIDWQMWFAAMNDFRYHPWILNLVAKLLAGDRNTLGLLSRNPFPESPPRAIRAVHYLYRFSTWDERAKTGAWWVRVRVGDYLPPLSLDQAAFTAILREAGFGVPVLQKSADNGAAP